MSFPFLSRMGVPSRCDCTATTTLTAISRWVSSLMSVIGRKAVRRTRCCSRRPENCRSSSRLVQRLGFLQSSQNVAHHQFAIVLDVQQHQKFVAVGTILDAARPFVPFSIRNNDVVTIHGIDAPPQPALLPDHTDML